MPHLVNPIGFRLIVNKKWNSAWFADKKQYRDYFFEDRKIRELLQNRLKSAGLERVEIERSVNDIRITVVVLRPGLVIGRGGLGIEALKKDLQKSITGRLKNFNVVESKKGDLSAKLVGENIAGQLIRRYPFRRAVDQAMERTMQSGALGIKVEIGGRLGGLERARTEKKSRGEVPVSTIDENIDYALTLAETKFGTIGIKVWIHKI
ncbi:MAG: 30S ribosomal protein S3 [candidate division CPR1 bacterium GW2011_GWA2_42_17]|uniref:Small ribosomal subunit protein uS3 n=1 Tax=candidate division CPR1 bacterium GW2011_GWA2_42_17 TaxID=1618341 RepID=A0A0G1C2N8_9BACT|nr:MAG: 30S ribosomal protein S3 [candidate division CPR1 bacterium GW2011_GWA2_42_17]